MTTLLLPADRFCRPASSRLRASLGRWSWQRC